MKGIGMAGGAPLQVQGALTNLARTVAPIGIGLTAGRVGGGIGGGAAGNVGSAALGLAGYGGIGNEGLGGSAVPPGMGPYGNIGPTGYPLDVLNPLGQDAGRRLRTVKDAETLRDATNIVLPTVRKFSEQAKRDDFSRNMASEAIKKNIQLNAELTKAMQTAGLQMGTTAAQQAGDALTSKYTY
jgi:hypothetical protein